jgi:hypothetical protein
MTYRVTLLGGKYTIEHTNGTNFKAYRNGTKEVWRDLTGDGLVLALVQKIEELEESRKLDAKIHARDFHEGHTQW